MWPTCVLPSTWHCQLYPPLQTLAWWLQRSTWYQQYIYQTQYTPATDSQHLTGSSSVLLLTTSLYSNTNRDIVTFCKLRTTISSPGSVIIYNDTYIWPTVSGQWSGMRDDPSWPSQPSQTVSVCMHASQLIPHTTTHTYQYPVAINYKTHMHPMMMGLK